MNSFSASVYLAGPIAGLDYDGATGWRDAAAKELADADIKALSPLRGQENLRSVGLIGTGGRDDHPLSTESAIFARDHNDVRNCDVVLMYLRGADRVSIGSMFEAAWAVELRKPLVLVIETGNPHDHAFLRQAAAFVVDNLPDALEVVRHIIG
jgi:nucleoside 2-deoxyribosyltransferase